MFYCLVIPLPDLNEFLFGDQEPWFVLEILLRTLVMYLVLLFGLRLMGKRGVRQLTIFELVVIIGLGSAAGDPMFYKEVKPGLPILPHKFKEQIKLVPLSGIYACAHCGETQEISQRNGKICPECKKEKWIKASDDVRIN